MTQPTIEQMLEFIDRSLNEETQKYYQAFHPQATPMIKAIRAALTAQQLPPSLDKYYLQDSRSYVGNSMVWWGKGKSGYFCGLEDAHVFTKADAFSQHRIRDTDILWPKQYIDSLASHHVDIQRVNHSAAIAAAKGE